MTLAADYDIKWVFLPFIYKRGFSVGLVFTVLSTLSLGRFRFREPNRPSDPIISLQTTVVVQVPVPSRGREPWNKYNYTSPPVPGRRKCQRSRSKKSTRRRSDLFRPQGPESRCFVGPLYLFLSNFPVYLCPLFPVNGRGLRVVGKTAGGGGRREYGSHT